MHMNVQDMRYFKMETEWRRSLPTSKQIRLLDIFPEARGIVISNIRQAIARDLRFVAKLKRSRYAMMKLADKSYASWFWRRTVDRVVNVRVYRETLDGQEFGRKSETLQQIEKRLHSNRMRLKYMTQPQASGILTLNDVNTAREHPITDLIEVNRAGYALCPLHNDKKPSLKVYLDSNSWYCFSQCNIGGDVIKFVIERDGLTFPQAVRYLIGK